MSETLLQYQHTVTAPDGTAYEARACGGPLAGGTWQGWIEFVPVGGGDAVNSPRETTQPNRTDTEYWATGLTAVYLEGALRRALAGPMPVAAAPLAEPTIFDGPAPRLTPASTPVDSVLDPFSVYQKGEALLRRQLGALSAWHLVNIITAYDLSAEPPAALNRLAGRDLIDIIVSAVASQKSHRLAR